MPPEGSRQSQMDKVRRLSQEIIQKYPGMFGTDYNDNKEQLAKIAIIHSKMIRNKLVGKITKAMIAAASAQAEEEAKTAGTASEGASLTTISANEKVVSIPEEGQAPIHQPAEPGQ
jgi:ribosomal protein S17E